MANLLTVDSNNKFISFGIDTTNLVQDEKNKKYETYLKNDNFTIVNNFNIINDFILKKNNFTKNSSQEQLDNYTRYFNNEDKIIFKKFTNKKLLDLNKLYINIFKLCNLDKNDIIFKDIIPVIISFDSQDELQILDSNNQIIKDVPYHSLYLSGLDMIPIFLELIFIVNKENYPNFAKNIIAIPNSYLVPDSSIIEFTLSNFLNKNKNNDNTMYIALFKKYFIILITKLNKSSINFNIKIANVYYFINCICILMIITLRDKDKKYINNYETFLINLTNILPDINCNITNELYTFNPDFIMNQNNDMYSYFTNTIYGNSLMYNIYYCCCSILCCICILFSLYKIFKK